MRETCDRVEMARPRLQTIPNSTCTCTSTEQIHVHVSSWQHLPLAMVLCDDFSGLVGVGVGVCTVDCTSTCSKGQGRQTPLHINTRRVLRSSLARLSSVLVWQAYVPISLPGSFLHCSTNSTYCRKLPSREMGSQIYGARVCSCQEKHKK